MSQLGCKRICVLTLACVIAGACSDEERLGRNTLTPGAQPEQVRLVAATEGASGVAYHPGRESVFVASDDGDLVELSMAFEHLRSYRAHGDLEGISINPATGRVYLASEREGAILEYDLDAGRVLRTMVVDFKTHDAFEDKDAGNDGLEGVAVVPGEGGNIRLFAVVQSDPARLIELARPLKDATKLSKRMRRRIEDRGKLGADLLGKVERLEIRRVIDLEIDPLSDVAYVEELEGLVVVSSRQRKAFVVDLDGRVRGSFRVPGEKPEGFTVLPAGDLLVADDAGGLWLVPDGLSKVKSIARIEP